MMKVRQRMNWVLGPAFRMVVIAAWKILDPLGETRLSSSARQGWVQESGVGPRLVSIEPLPPSDGPMCEWMRASAATTLTETLAQEQMASARSPESADQAS